MADADLYREFVPVAMRQWRLEESGWSSAAVGVVTDLDSLLFGARSSSSTRLALLLGDYGTGKSSCAINLTYRLAVRSLTRPGESEVIPIYIDLRDFRRVSHGS
jgi:predicted NACHT family NTPase